ncbi:type I-E CRISPR-associated protein Cas6/Cse3/CasE [Nocardiopsis alba]|uniref:Type I-E CRISPR-associated protein Cas6/Cse3/CasE n=1 Tax=Nocardiopsis alba TaxID=53437 RepID=A0A7K2IWN4_9ACTN|nr:type I-E CRISPR-associated protein Cas6/Cse3/CasE [Nocardiopsis alba]MYR34361.1 type I-E CRISPR-associated protein Cas6/Cse3/CasE [Nocardiopsis alba]
MYLSRIFLNPRRQGTTLFIGSPQRLHAAVLASFPQDPPTGASDGPRVLWRLDTDDWRRPVLWVSSPDKPSFEHITDEYGWPRAEPPFETRSMEHLLARLVAGQEYVFRATVNPVKTKAGEPDAEGLRGRGRVVPLAGAAARTEWFVGRAERWGFEIPLGKVQPPEGGPAWAVETRDSRRLRFSKKGAKRQVVLQTVTFEGRLRVTDVDLFRRTLTHGVGRARGYGCGLFTLAR